MRSWKPATKEEDDAMVTLIAFERLPMRWQAVP